MLPEHDPETPEDLVDDIDQDIEPENEPLDDTLDDADLADDITDSEETPPADGDWKAPTREEWEAMQAQHETMRELLGDNFENVLNGTQESEEGGVLAQDEIQNLITPRQFALTPEASNKILVEGDGNALVAAFKEFADVQQHNFRIEMNQAVLRGIQYAAPVQAATSKFYERNPELLGMRNLVENHMYTVRNQMPQANELQILRMVEQRLGSVIATAKKIAQQHAKGTPRNLAPAPTGAAAPPSGRDRTAATKKAEPSTATRLKELQDHAASTTY